MSDDKPRPLKSQITLPGGQTWQINLHDNVHCDIFGSAWWSRKVILRVLKREVTIVGEATKRAVDALTNDERRTLIVWLEQVKVNEGGWR